MRLLLIRHGEPNYAIDSLTPKGWREAELLSKRLERESIDSIYVSPLGRACDTAAATLRARKATAEVLPWLREFHAPISDPKTGEKGHCWDLMPQYRLNCPELFDKDRWRENGLMKMGPVEEEEARVTGAFDALLAEHGLVRDGLGYRVTADHEKTLAFFCHFGVSMVLTAHLLGVSPVLMLHAFLMPPSSVTTIVTEERKQGFVAFRCIGLGDISHLYGGSEPFSRAGLFPEVNHTDQILREFTP